MIDVMNEILATQRRHYIHIGSMVERVRNEGAYFFDLDMTKRRQAELLGSRPQQQLMSPTKGSMQGLD